MQIAHFFNLFNLGSFVRKTCEMHGYKNEDKKMETEINQHFHDAVNSDFECDSCNGGG